MTTFNVTQLSHNPNLPNLIGSNPMFMINTEIQILEFVIIHFQLPLSGVSIDQGGRDSAYISKHQYRAKK